MYIPTVEGPVINYRRWGGGGLQNKRGSSHVLPLPKIIGGGAGKVQLC